MLLRMKLPKTVLWVINLLVIYILMFTFFRLVTFLAFRPEEESVFDLFPTFLLGLRFDLRWIAFLLMPILVVSLRPEYSPFYSLRNRKYWTWYLAVVTFIVFFFFAADFGCFSYNKTRLNASALNFAEDPGISLSMLWESYPLLWFIAALVVAVLLLKWMFRKSHIYIISKTDGRGIPYRRKWFLVSVVVLGGLMYGSASRQPLKWINAFNLHDSFKSYLALNPLQNFFTTLKFRNPQNDDGKAKSYFPLMAEWMNLKSAHFSYNREAGPTEYSVSTRPNVVIVLCESFSMYKSSMSGNPMNATPFFKTLSEGGIFFERCFTPHFSTARGLFATVTGIPDVQLSKFSTRNPEALDQHTIINDFKDYQKFYFLGGNPSFNNFEGLLKNVEGLNLITEGKFKAKPINVWGISDKDLFLEANENLKKEKGPFLAIIQTADNHRPYMIPEEDKDFEKKWLPLDTLVRYGFESAEEYNSFRYADYCFQKFMEAAQKEAYFKNTIFVFVGDHGVAGNATAMYPDAWTTERLTDEHVPLLFYAPSLLKPQIRKETVSQIDLLPTIASLSGQHYTNTTLGRNLLSRSPEAHYAFIIHHDEGRIGMVSDSFYFTKNLNFKQEELHFFKKETNLSKGQEDSLKNKMSELTSAYYETAKWMLLNNKKN